MPVYAECGGFIYLTGGVVATKNVRSGLTPMVGIFPVTTRMLSRRKALGYREVQLIGDSLLGPTGTIARGHEFHYSEMDAMPPEVERVYRVRKSDSGWVQRGSATGTASHRTSISTSAAVRGWRLLLWQIALNSNKITTEFTRVIEWQVRSLNENGD